MERKPSRGASAICPLCKGPITAAQRPAVKFSNGQEVHPDCYVEFEQEQVERRRLGEKQQPGNRH